MHGSRDLTITNKTKQNKQPNLRYQFYSHINLEGDTKLEPSSIGCLHKSMDIDLF